MTAKRLYRYLINVPGITSIPDITFRYQELAMVRDIKANALSVTGNVAPNQPECENEIPFESTLERDLITLAQFHDGVKRITAQPLTIEFFDPKGKSRSYTPDLLVEYYPQRDPSWPAAVLFEVKYRKDLWRDWNELKPKFRAAKQLATQRGWRFKIMTEVEIRTPYLSNVQFLRAYRREPCESPCKAMIYDRLSWMGQATVEALSVSVSMEERTRAEAIATVWSMIAKRELETDLLRPFTMETCVWLPPRRA